MKAITTKFLPCTNIRGSRVKAFDLDGNSVTVSYNHGVSAVMAHAEAAIALCRKMQWYGELTAGGIKGGYVFVWSGPSLGTVTITQEGYTSTL